MTALQELEKKQNKINESDFSPIAKMLSESFSITHSYKKNTIVSKKEKLIDNFSLFLKNYLELHLVSSKTNKLELIKFIDKLNLQKELIEVAIGETKTTDIKNAANRLGKKAQSAFKNK